MASYSEFMNGKQTRLYYKMALEFVFQRALYPEYRKYKIDKIIYKINAIIEYLPAE